MPQVPCTQATVSTGSFAATLWSRHDDSRIHGCHQRVNSLPAASPPARLPAPSLPRRGTWGVPPVVPRSPPVQCEIPESSLESHYAQRTRCFHPRAILPSLLSGTFALHLVRRTDRVQTGRLSGRAGVNTRARDPPLQHITLPPPLPAPGLVPDRARRHLYWRWAYQ